MDTLVSWERFVARYRNAPPLAYLSGARIPLPKGQSCIVHSHRDTIEIVYHPRGRGVTNLTGADPISFEEGAVVIYAPDQAHDQALECEGEDLCVTLAVPPKAKVVPTQSFVVPRVEDPSIIEDMRRLSHGRVEISAAQQAIFNLRATSTLFALVDLARVRDKESDDIGERYVQKAEEFIRENFALQIGMGDAANHAGIGYDHLRHLVLARRERSLVDYLTQVRIERAKTLLVHAELPLSQIATMSGFRNEHYFSSVFRRLAGCPPGRYRSTQAGTRGEKRKG